MPQSFYKTTNYVLKFYSKNKETGSDVINNKNEKIRKSFFCVVALKRKEKGRDLCKMEYLIYSLGALRQNNFV